MFFAIIKPLLTARTLGKVEIYTTPDKWLPVVKSRLPLDQLPIQYGGAQEGYKRPVKGEIFSNGCDADISNGSAHVSHMVAVQIPAGVNTMLEFTIANSGSTLKWAFKVEAYDLGFTVTFNNEKLIPNKRYDAEAGVIVGSILCEKAGEYSLNFDNSYSKMRRKMVSYNVDIIEPTINNNQ